MACAQCFTGTAREDETPKGKIVDLHGRKTYVAEPEGEVKGIVIMIPDAFGIEFVNNKILVDHYAAKGSFKVYLPDFMDGYSVSADHLNDMAKIMDTKATVFEWLSKPFLILRAIPAFGPMLYRTRFAISMPRVVSFFTAVRSAEGSHLPIGAAGFCWGGQHAFALASGLTDPSSGKPLIDAAFTAHPSNVAVPADVEAVRKPMSVAVGDRDVVMAVEQVRRVEEILKGIEGVQSEVVVYEGAGHSFAVRGDWKNEKQVAQAVEAEDQAVNWFKKVFATVSY